MALKHGAQAKDIPKSLETCFSVAMTLMLRICCRKVRQVITDKQGFCCISKLSISNCLRINLCDACCVTYGYRIKKVLSLFPRFRRIRSVAT